MVEVLIAHRWHVGIIGAALLVLLVAEIAARRWRREQQKPIKARWVHEVAALDNRGREEGTNMRRDGESRAPEP